MCVGSDLFLSRVDFLWTMDPRDWEIRFLLSDARRKKNNARSYFIHGEYGCVTQFSEPCCHGNGRHWEHRFRGCFFPSADATKKLVWIKQRGENPPETPFAQKGPLFVSITSFPECEPGGGELRSLIRKQALSRQPPWGWRSRQDVAGALTLNGRNPT